MVQGAKLRILFVVLEMDLGGLQRVVNLLFRGLDRERFEPFLCCLDRGGAFCAGLEPDRVRVMDPPRRPVAFDGSLFRRLCRLIREERIDLVHSQNGCTLYAALAATLTGRPIVHTDHGRLIPDTLAARLEDRVCSLGIDRFVAVSEELREYLAARVGVRRRGLCTIINGVDTERFRPLAPEERAEGRRALGLGAGDLVFGTLCRLDPVKNLDFMVDGFARLVRERPRCRLLLIGDGPLRPALEQRLRAAGLEGWVRLLGRRDDAEQVLPLLDVYLSTSLSEGTSMTILEAMACGVPVVASAVGGNPRLVGAECGALYPSQREEEFVARCRELVDDPGAVRAKGAAARSAVLARFSLAQCVAAYARLYEGALARA